MNPDANGSGSSMRRTEALEVCESLTLTVLTKSKICQHLQSGSAMCECVNV